MSLTSAQSVLPSAGAWQVVAGFVAGAASGVVAALMGVAGGELLSPTIVLLFPIDIKVAESPLLAVSLPTMLVAFARYSRDDSFAVLRTGWRLPAAMALGSVVGTVAGATAGPAPNTVLLPLLAALLVLSAYYSGITPPTAHRHERELCV